MPFALFRVPFATRSLLACCVVAALTSVARAIPGGTWSQIVSQTPSGRAAAAGFYDARRDRYVFTGGYSPYTAFSNDVLAFDPVSGVWSDTPRPPAFGDWPFGGDMQVACADSLHDAAVVLNFDLAYGNVWYRRLLLGDSLHWEQIPRSAHPDSLAIPRSIWTSAYDTRRARALTVGTWNGQPAVLGISAADRSIVSAAPGPPLVATVGLAYDPVRDRYLAFGTDTPIYLATRATLHAWAWSPQNPAAPWIALATASAEPTLGYIGFTSTTGLAYDADGDRMVMLLTESEQLVPWTLSLEPGHERWSSLPTTGAAPFAYYARQLFTDTRRHRFVAFGSSLPTTPSELWYLTLGDRAVWTRQQNPSASFHSGAAVALDTSRDRMLLFGGCTCESYKWPVRYRTTLQDTWGLDLVARPQWKQHVTAAATAQAYGAAAVYDAARDRFLAFGGTDLHDEPAFDATVHVLGGALDGAWDSLAVEGERPAPRSRHTLILDTAHDRIVLFGGTGADYSVLSDLWELPLASTPLRWRRLTPAGADAPAGRYSHTAIYDPVRHRMIAYGGYVRGEGFGPRGDVWSLSLTDSVAWQRIGTAADSLGGDGIAAPKGRAEHAAVYDPVGRRMLVWSGRLDRRWTNAFSGELWSLDCADDTWHRLSPAGAAPAPRGQHAMVYDAGHDRLVMFGGGQDRPLGFEGDHRNDTGIGFDDLWTLDFARAGATAPASDRACTLYVPQPLVRRGAAATLRIAMAARGALQVRMFDVRGRQRSGRAAGILERGGQSIDAPETAMLEPGIYLVRIETAGGSATARIVVVP